MNKLIKKNRKDLEGVIISSHIQFTYFTFYEKFMASNGYSFKESC